MSHYRPMSPAEFDCLLDQSLITLTDEQKAAVRKMMGILEDNSSSTHILAALQLAGYCCAGGGGGGENVNVTNFSEVTGGATGTLFNTIGAIVALGNGTTLASLLSGLRGGGSRTLTDLFSILNTIADTTGTPTSLRSIIDELGGGANLAALQSLLQGRLLVEPLSKIKNGVSDSGAQSLTIDNVLATSSAFPSDITRLSLYAYGTAARYEIGNTADPDTSHFIAQGERIDIRVDPSVIVSVIADSTIAGSGKLEISAYTGA